MITFKEIIFSANINRYTCKTNSLIYAKYWKQVIERLAGANSVEPEIAYRKLLFIGRLLSVPNIPVTVKNCLEPNLIAFMLKLYHLLASSLQFLSHGVSMILIF